VEPVEPIHLFGGQVEAAVLGMLVEMVHQLQVAQAVLDRSGIPHLHQLLQLHWV
jgi:hypothetical protein